MRIAASVVIAILTLGFASGLGLPQTHAGDTRALESIHMKDALTGWAVTMIREPGVNGLLRTTDGGTQWKDVTPLDSAGQRVRVDYVAVLTSLIAWVESSEGIPATTIRVFRTVDGGRTWRKSALPGGGAVNFINTHDGWLLAGLGAYSGNEEVEIHRSTDGGETWIKIASATHDNESHGLRVAGNKVAITFLNATTGWITGGGNANDWLLLYVTHDSGHRWRQQKLPVPPQVAPHWNALTKPPTFFTERDGIISVSYSIFSESYQETGLVVVFYATHDGGTTWTHTAPIPVCCSSGFADVNHGWVTNGNALYATSDGGHQWTKIEPSQHFADVKQLDFISPRVGWAVRRTSPFLLKTVDGGHTWESVSYTVSR